jgi:hypothetical protein
MPFPPHRSSSDVTFAGLLDEARAEGAAFSHLRYAKAIASIQRLHFPEPG